MSQPSTPDAPTADALSSTNARRIALTVAAAFFMESLDGTVIVTALPAIATAYGLTTLDASLGITVYLMAIAVCVPAAGWCADRFGARRVFSGVGGDGCGVCSVRAGRVAVASRCPTTGAC